MPALTHNLQRFVDAARGPVISLGSTAYAGFFDGRLWHSTAELSRKLVVNRPELLVCRYCGFGWSADKEESRRKAVVEALERWAYNYYSMTAPAKAGVDINDSANGFAAMPADMGAGLAAVNAYCEALERWVLNAVWDGGDVYFVKCAGAGGVPEKVLRRVSAGGEYYGLRIAPEKLVKGMPAELHFRLCLLKTAAGGVVSGSACSASAADALLRSGQEAYLHAAVIARAAAGGAPVGGMLEPRLVSFAKSRSGYRIVSELLKPGPGRLHTPPPVQFSRALPGPWEPEVAVHRVLLSDSKPEADELCTGRCYF
ncbi:MAG TPA: hypothetical protein PKI19_05775 [Elusimicrobiales bacterium]|nr:hypothetical protein [Elusimicrobiales bacterium]